MAVVTGLRAKGADRVVVSLDGAPWRTLRAEVVLRAGLSTGLELDRARLRQLRRELRRSEAVSAAARALARRDFSRRGLEARLARARIPRAYREEALAVVAGAGILDDDRSARLAAERLVRRDAGDAAIRFRLSQDGFPPAAIEGALAELPPESERAAAVLEARGRRPRTLQYLARRGFSPDSLEAAAEDLLAGNP